MQMRPIQLSSVIASLLVSAVAMAQQSQPAPTTPLLGPGDRAPEIGKPISIKGETITALDPKKSYVIEFWATWCGPCVAAFPHLTKLAKANKDITFVGVNAFEDPATTNDDIKKFVAKQGSKMDYNVVRDQDEVLAKGWMEAAKQPGIPTAFLVHQESFNGSDTRINSMA